jgi:serine/threonine protein kinase
MVAHMSPRDLKPGQWVAGFRIIRRIGQGYFGLVFEAEKEGQRFALKFASHREGSGDAAQTDARIERELICLFQLRHRHIVRIWGAGHWPNPRTGYRYIVLDLVDGYTLEQWAERTHPTPHEVAVLIDKVFAAMEHMHGRNVFHRDLNLRNIMRSARSPSPRPPGSSWAAPECNCALSLATAPRRAFVECRALAGPPATRVQSSLSST